jgi:hypothetical protein
MQNLLAGLNNDLSSRCKNAIEKMKYDSFAVEELFRDFIQDAIKELQNFS